MSEPRESRAASNRLLRWIVIILIGACVFVLGLIITPRLIERSKLKWYEARLATSEPLTPRKSLTDAYNAMGFDVFSRLVKAHPGRNLLFSPASMAESLDMLSEGARGKTQDEIASVLRLNATTLQYLATSNANFLADLASTYTPTNIIFANGIWIKRNESVRKEYTDELGNDFDAHILSADLQSPKTPDAINDWIKSQTRGKITRLVSGPFDPATAMILVDTLYFKGEWMSPFDPATTHETPFKLLGGKIVRCQEMERDLDCFYFNTPLFQAAALPFNNGPPDLSTCMVLLLPRRNTLFNTLLNSLNTENWEKWQQSFKLASGSLALPRFKITAQSDIAGSLKACGIQTAFSDNADFTGISTNKPLFVSECQQAVTLDVNEKGAEATSATEMALSRGGPSPPFFSMVVTHPFVVAICSRDTILFLAAITDPR